MSEAPITQPVANTDGGDENQPLLTKVNSVDVPIDDTESQSSTVVTAKQSHWKRTTFYVVTGLALTTALAFFIKAFIDAGEFEVSSEASNSEMHSYLTFVLDSSTLGKP